MSGKKYIWIICWICFRSREKWNHLEKLNYMERFYRHGYEELLMKSIERRPTIHTLFMMNRLINGGGDRDSIWLY